MQIQTTHWLTAVKWLIKAVSPDEVSYTTYRYKRWTIDRCPGRASIQRQEEEQLTMTQYTRRKPQKNKSKVTSVLFPKVIRARLFSMVNLTSSLMVKMLSALVSTISNSQLFLQKNVSSFCLKATHIFFSTNNSIYAIFNVQSFNDTLTNDIVSFEQLGTEC